MDHFSKFSVHVLMQMAWLPRTRWLIYKVITTFASDTV